ncbi:MAG: LCP family protein [Anaerolineaceae bacterium]
MNRRIIIQVVIGVIIVGLLITGIIVVQAFRTPLAPQMTVIPATATLPPIPTATKGLETSPAPVMEITPMPEEMPTPEPTVVSTEIPGACGGSGSMTILLTGKDAGYFKPPYGADAIRLIDVDYVASKVTIFSIPRNLMVKTANLENYGTSETRLGDAYQIIMEKESQAADVDIKATSALAQIIYDNFGVLPDHYVTIKSTLIKDLVNAIGGIEVDVPAEISSDNLKLSAGKQRLDGQTAQEFLRFRENSYSSEWNRIPRQNAVILGLQKKILSPSIVTQIPELINQFRYGTTTDLSVQQIVNLTCMAGSVSSQNITFESINPNSINIKDDGSMVIIDNEIVKQQFRSVFGPD